MDEECYMGYHAGAVFTVELGSLVENGFDLGLDKYPLYDENRRATLNAKIIEHYWFREIGFETPQVFKRFLNRRMNEIMPYYNGLYKTTAKDFDPFINHDMTTTGTTKGNSDQTRETSRLENTATDASSTTANDTDSTARNLVSATPQMQLSGHEDYATNVTDTNSRTSAKGTSEQESTVKSDATETAKANAATVEDYATHSEGLVGMTKSQALMQYREALLNIDMMVIEELGDLFMGIYTDYWNAL